ncbi:unnamed protein product [Rotaria sordida]|uniref:Uncharacterized protein n=1 Tax=Rotaria sordida TaxID=392033 RepID=A0A815K3Y2_9BILA|nr:unnamed protein product [Rotaria sordida]
MLPSTFEILPDEILMIIIRYSGDIYTIFRTFSGLNQRINNILVDKRMHLLTDFLFVDTSDVNIDYYYKSKIFHDISQQLLSLTITENDQQLRQCLQSLVVFHIKYKQSADQLKSSIKQFQSIRMQLTDDDANNFDMELAKTFKGFKKYSNPIQLNIDQEIFVYTSQIEILKIVLDENILNVAMPSDELLPYNFTKSLGNIIIYNRLEKKECKVVKQLLNLSPSLIHRLDEDGNDPLLYVCLKVRGRRHRLIEYLIKMESDLQRRNSKDENVFDVLQLKGNRNLLKS